MGIKNKIYIWNLKFARQVLKLDTMGIFLKRQKVEELIEKNLPPEKQKEDNNEAKI